MPSDPVVTEHFGVSWDDLSRVVRCANLAEALDIAAKFPPGRVVYRTVSDWMPVEI